MARLPKSQGFDRALENIFPVPVVATRAPGTGDTNFPLGQVWVRKDTAQIYMLAAISSGSATWTLASPGASDVDTLTGDSGGALSPTGGNMNILGGTNMTVAGAGSTLTVNMDAAITLATSVSSPLYTVAAANDLDITSASGQDIVIKMGDAAGVNKVSFTDSADVEVAAIDSNGGFTMGAITFTGLLTANASATINTAGTALNLATDNSADAVNIGTGTSARAISIGTSAAAHTVAIGNAAAGAITLDTAAGISLDAAAASNFNVTGATNDLTLGSAGGRVIVDAGEDAAQAIYLHANAGTSETIQLHADQGTGVNSIYLLSDVGGLTLEATGLASDDAINLVATLGGIDMDAALQINIASSENAADAIVINASAGGIDITAAGGAAEDIDIANTAGSTNISGGEAAADAITIQAAAGGIDMDGALQVNIASSQNAADAVRINASAGGIDIDAAGAAGEDIDIANAAGSINLTAGENDAGAIYIRANGGVSERVRLHADQGTGVDSVFLESDVGGITLAAGLASDDAINLSASAGGVDIDGALQVNIASSENAADAILINASAGGIDITAAGGAAEDIDITNTAGSVNITAGESAADAMILNASGAAGAIQLQSGTGGVVMDSGLTMNVTTVNNAASPYAVLGSDYCLAVDTGAGAVTLTLPAAPATGRMIVVNDEGGAAGASNITIDGNGNNVAAGGTVAATKPIDSNYGSMILVYTGTIWNGMDIA